MKKMRRMISILLTMALLISMCACGNNGEPGQDSPDRTNNSPGNGREKATLNINVFDGGYGTEWLEAIAGAFEAEYTGVDVVIETTKQYSEIRSQVEAERYVADIIFSTMNYISAGVDGYVLELTDLYDSYPYGEDGQLTIREKLAEAVDANEFDGKYYQIPVHAGNTGLVYNKIYLDALYGEGNYELPVTSNQLLDMCKDIKSRDGWAFVYTNSTDAEYAGWLRDIWTAQYMGYEDFKNFYDLSYTDATGAVKKAETAKELSDALYTARASALKPLAEMMSSKLGYVPESAASMSFTQAQAYFVGFTSQPDVKVVDGHKGAAFMVNGDWLYREIEKYSESVELDIRFMRTPVNSQIIDKLGTVDTEEQLVECIKYIDTVIDGTGGTRPSYLSDEDYDRLYEARRMIWSTHAQQIATIPANCSDETLAKDFLRFLASDASALMYSDSLDGMASIYNSDVCAENKLNSFTDSMNKALKEPLYVTDLSTPYTVFGSLRYFRYYYFVQALYKCTDVNSTVSEILDWNAANLAGEWQKIVDSYQSE